MTTAIHLRTMARSTTRSPYDARVTTVVALWVLGAAALHAVWNGLVKGRAGDPLAASLGIAMCWTLLGGPLLLVVEPPGIEAAPHIAASVAIHLVYFGLLVSAYRVGDLSFVYTVARGLPPAIVAIVAWIVVDERPSALGLVGVAAIVAGVLALQTRAPGEQEGATRRKALAFALATAVCIAAYTVVDGMGGRLATSATSYLLWLMVGQGFFFSIGATLFGGRTVAREALARWRIALVGGVMAAAGYGIAIWAMTQAPLALVAALRETSVVFAALIGTIVLGEPFGPRRVIASVLVAAGAVCVRFGG